MVNTTLQSWLPLPTCVCLQALSALELLAWFFSLRSTSVYRQLLTFTLHPKDAALIIWVMPRLQELVSRHTYEEQKPL